MNFSQLPTDNFYKFVSFSGFFIIFFSLSLFYFEHQLQIDSISLSGDIAKVKYEVDENTNDVAELKTRNSSNILESELGIKVQRKNRKNKYLVEDLKSKQELILYYQKRINQLKPLSWLGLIVGILLSGTGLTLWYRRSQRVQDLKLLLSVIQNES